jgi:hypothetical protein
MPSAPLHFPRPGGLLALAALAALSSLAGAGCYYGDTGLPPPSEGFYFPTGLVVSPGRSVLYVANSDFDLQYNGGTIQAVNLITLRSELGPMLTSIRCSESNPGNPAVCVTTQTDEQPLDAVCHAVQASQGTLAPGKACVSGSDCESSLCPSGTCVACASDADCPGGSAPATLPETLQPCYGYGRCNLEKGPGNGVCMLSCNLNTILTPSMCTALAPPYATTGNPPVALSATVGAFASGAVLAVNPAGPGSGARLFVPVRGDPSITWFDVSDDRPAIGSTTCLGVGAGCSPGGAANTTCCTGYCDPTGACGFNLYCGETGATQRCDDDHRIGVDPYDNLRDMSIPVEPVGLDVSTDGLEIVTAHNASGNPAVGLSTNIWPTSAADACAPHLTGTAVACPSFDYYLNGSASVANGPTEVAHVPAPALASNSAFPSNAYQQGFLVTYDAAPEVDLFRANPDNQAGASPARPFLTRASQGAITVNANGNDSRGIVIDPTARQKCEGACSTASTTCVAGCAALSGMAAQQCESACNDTAGTCLRACVAIPLPTFIANRAPPSLLIGQVTTTVVESNVSAGTGSGIFDTVSVYDQTPLLLGASKVALGTAIQPDGTAKTYVFTVTFDSRKIFMYDPVLNEVIKVIETGRGPHPIAFDACTDDCGPNETPHAYLYVGHFTDSYLGVIDLDMRYPATFGTMFASIGTPLPPLESH